MNAKKQKSKNHTDSNAISNSDTSPECNNTSSDELLSKDNISADLNIITDHSDKTNNTDHSNKNNNPNHSNKKSAPNGQQECGQLVKTQGVTCHFINSNYELKEAILAIKYASYSHDAVNIKAELEEIINDWGLFEK
ncbi:16824_t:CDS:2, partial [Cetraspora pellucida]